MTQCERIIKYINDFGSISSFEAYTDLGITQLGARLDNLQKEGYVFKIRQSKFNPAYYRDFIYHLIPYFSER